MERIEEKKQEWREVTEDSDNGMVAVSFRDS